MRLTFPWVLGKRTDILTIVLPLFLAAIYFLASGFLKNRELLALSLFIASVGQFHQGSSWFHYLDRRNRQHFVSSPSQILIWFVAPAAIIAGAVWLSYFSSELAYWLVMVWTAHHLIKQNTGVLLLYHNFDPVNGVREAIVDKNIESYCVYLPSTFFLLLCAMRLKEGFAQGPIFQTIVAGTGLASIGFIGYYLLQLVSQYGRGARSMSPPFCSG